MLVAALIVIIAGCASPAPKSAPPPSAAPPVAEPTAPQAARDTCGAAELKRFIGRPRTELPAPLWPDRERVACTTCPITQDYRPERVNVFFDAETGIVKEVRCG